MTTINQALIALRNACSGFEVTRMGTLDYSCYETVITIRIPYGISFDEEIEGTNTLLPSSKVTTYKDLLFSKDYKIPEVREIRYNGPATIVFWEDNTKTVVKVQPGEECYDPDKAFAMAVCKKLFGNKFNRHLAKAQKAFEKHCEKEHEKENTVSANDVFDTSSNAFYADAWKVFDPFLNLPLEDKKED